MVGDGIDVVAFRWGRCPWKYLSMCDAVASGCDSRAWVAVLAVLEIVTRGSSESSSPILLRQISQKRHAFQLRRGAALGVRVTLQ